MATHTAETDAARETPMLPRRAAFVPAEGQGGTGDTDSGPQRVLPAPIHRPGTVCVVHAVGCRSPSRNTATLSRRCAGAPISLQRAMLLGDLVERVARRTSVSARDRHPTRRFGQMTGLHGAQARAPERSRLDFECGLERGGVLEILAKRPECECQLCPVGVAVVDCGRDG